MHMISFSRFAATAVVFTLVAGCATQHHRAPVEDRGRAGGSSVPAPTPKPPPGAENAGKFGYYSVKPGDTLIRIALEAGQNYKDIASWNGLDNPNLIEVGQVLRVIPPAPEGQVATAAANLPAAKPITVPKVEARGLDSKVGPSGAVASAPSKPSSVVGPVAPAVTPSPAASDVASKDAADESNNWVWPSNGPVLGGYEEGKRKGVAIGGKEGDPVVAAGDGRVVYAGSGLRGYGNLVIIKHSGDYLTAYAHNKALLVKEDQVVRRGQKIAEMGSTDADRVQLHFELRKQGKPIDPAKQLPVR